MSTDKIEYISVDKLKFDSENPRVSASIDGESESAVIKWMFSDASLIDLISSISCNGYFTGEPLLAIKDGENYYVLEGNRRLASIKVLLNVELAPIYRKKIEELRNSSTKLSTLEKIPVVVYPNREFLENYLGARHFTGVKDWSPLAKSKYLYKLSKTDEFCKDGVVNYRALASTIGSKSDYVKRLIVSYRLYIRFKDEFKFFNILGVNEESLNYSSFYDACTLQANISKYIKLDLDSHDEQPNVDLKAFEELCYWLFDKDSGKENRINDSRDIRALNKIVGSKEALKYFQVEKCSIKMALVYTLDKEDIFKRSIKVALKSIKDANKNFSIEYLNETLKNEISEVHSISEMLLTSEGKK